ncbi:beta-ketoacyl-ACP synthase I [Exilibacterium tricleocarpae]|uniref:3-oxoacyl-[acyl-carrier-protein] synthase 1 n=1 Tax=Exilibacterium tricleocarpae TaxID=2591008 RepID=A0A545T2B5_9GAMM|nr:beta-ketoacyl-ACP synthase I [Exilibacterium tricleocarpae]TQV71343.1 beta-ketoacyl-ACP synthase I [Exilibacterium tricleocarpae]
MKRVVVTGIGIVSCLGKDVASVLDALRAGRSGIRYKEDYEELGFRSLIAGSVDIDFAEYIDRKTLRFMGDAAGYAYISMQQAIADAGLEDDQVSNERTGLIMGSGGASSQNLVESADILRARGIRRVGPYRVTQTMGSTTSACLATPFKIKGVNYSISSACATSAHCIGNAMEQIQLGKQDLVFAGGGEEEHWTMSSLFDAMGALSAKYNDTPEQASRPYDANRDGFVIAGGGGCVVLEELEHARARGAKIYAELVGYGANSDGYDMVAPSGEGAVRCMRQAMATVDGTIDYINTHGTSTPVGDVAELTALREVFVTDMPAISSTKSLTGHSLGAAGVQEAIYSLLMQQHNFVAASANIETLDPEAEGLPIATQRRDDVRLERVMSNSFGFGGTNSCLVFQRFSD